MSKTDSPLGKLSKGIGKAALGVIAAITVAPIIIAASYFVNKHTKDTLVNIAKAVSIDLMKNGMHDAKSAYTNIKEASEYKKKYPAASTIYTKPVKKVSSKPLTPSSTPDVK